MDNFADICCETESVAIFECCAVYFGLLGFKPKELFIFTSSGVRIVANEKLKFNIPMGHVREAHVDFVSATNSIIAISVTAQWAAHIERSIRLAQNLELPSDGNNFTSAKITLVCEKLSEVTKKVLRTLFPYIEDIDVEVAKKILRTLCATKENLTKLTISEPAVYSLIESTSLSGAKNDGMTVGVTLSHSEPLNNCTTRKISFDETTLMKTDTTLNSVVSAKKNDLLAGRELRSKSTEFRTTVDVPTEMTISPDSNIIPSAYNDNRNLLLYPHEAGHASITLGDYMCLTSGEYLNDKIIDFYLKYIHNNVIRTNAERKKTYIFSTYFYHVLTSKGSEKKNTDQRSEAQLRYDRVKNWTRNVNIFEKDFLILPVNERLHWFLIVICFPNMLMPVYSKNFNNNDQNSDDVVKQPVILLFNSLPGTMNCRQTSILRDYLSREYNAKIPHAAANPPNFTKETIPGHRVKVPQQHNLTDCGLYVLQYVEEFFKQPIKDFRVPITGLSKWFNLMTIKRKREEIAKLIERLINEHHQMMGSRPKIKLPNIPFPTLNGELMSRVIKVVEDVEIVEDETK